MTRARFTLQMREDFNRQAVVILRELGGVFYPEAKGVCGWSFETIAGQIVVMPQGISVRIHFLDYDAAVLAHEQGRFILPGGVGLQPKKRRLDYSEWTETTPLAFRLDIFKTWLQALLSASKR